MTAQPIKMVTPSFPAVPFGGEGLVAARYHAMEAALALEVAFWAEEASDANRSFHRDIARDHLAALASILGYTLEPISQAEAAE